MPACPALPRLLLVALLLAVVPGAAAQTALYAQVHLSYFEDEGEYAVTFASSVPLDSPRVEYWEVGGGGGEADAALQAPGPPEDSVHNYAARIPATSTRYRILSGQLPIDPAARTFMLRGPPPAANDTANVAFIADNGRDPNATRVHTAVAALEPGLVIIGGDIAYTGQDPEKWDQWFTQVEFFAAVTPVMPAVGNHDAYDCLAGTIGITNPGRCGLDQYRARFTLPGEPGTNYAFTWGAARFISIDTEAYFYAETTRWKDRPGTTPEEMEAFLARELAAHRDEWTIVYFHRPPFTTNLGHTENPYSHVIRENLTSILQDGAADLVLAGHEHAYERSWPLSGSDGSVVHAGAREAREGQGTVYVVGGGGGAGLNKEWGPAEPWEAVRFAGHEVLALEISPERIAAKAVCATGARFDDTGKSVPCRVGEVIDEFAIVRRASEAPVESEEASNDIAVGLAPLAIVLAVVVAARLRAKRRS